MATAGVQGRGRGAEGRAAPVASSDASASCRGGVGEEGGAHLEDRGAGAWNLPVGTRKGAVIRGLVSSPVAGPGEPGYLPTEGLGPLWEDTVRPSLRSAEHTVGAQQGQVRTPGLALTPTFSPRGTRRFPPEEEVGRPLAIGSSPGRGLGPSPHRPHPDAPLGHTRAQPGATPQARGGDPLEPLQARAGPGAPPSARRRRAAQPRGEPHARAATPRAGALGANRPAWTHTGRWFHRVSPPPMFAPSGPLSRAPPSGPTGGPRGCE